MRLTIYFFIASITSGISAKAQSDSSYPALRIGTSFFSESFWTAEGASEGEGNTNYFFYNNGWNIEAQYTILCHLSKVKEGRKQRGSEALNFGVNGYFYGIENQSFNTIVTADLDLEKEFFFGLQLFGKFGFGTLRTKIIADVYSVSADGTVSQNNNLSENEIILPSSIGLGWNFESLINIPICLRIRTMHFSKSFGPFYNSKTALLMGIEYKFKNINTSPIKEFK